MTVQAERLNFLRFISHFRAVHRGASFAGLRTTSVRKLLPEYVLVSLLMAVNFIRFFSFSPLSFLLSDYLSPLMQFADHGDFYVLFTHLMGNHAGYWIIWLLPAVITCLQILSFSFAGLVGKRIATKKNVCLHDTFKYIVCYILNPSHTEKWGHKKFVFSLIN